MSHTLRQYYAAHAPTPPPDFWTGIVAAHGSSPVTLAKGVSDWAWIYADAMIARGEEPGEDSDLLKAIRLILPLAKGYTAAHPVGSNSQYVKAAEDAVAKAEGKS